MVSMRLAWCLPIAALAFAGCLDDHEETVDTSQSAVEAPLSSDLWIVTSGDDDCDRHLRNTCPRSAVACLVNAECNAFFSCTRACGDSPDECFGHCRKEHPASWKLIDPFASCARNEPSCR